MLRNLFRRVSDLFAGAGKATDELFDDLEEVLIASDVSAKVATQMVEQLRKQVREERARTVPAVEHLFHAQIAEMLKRHATPLATQTAQPPLLYLIVGVNGTGKTTTIGKLAYRFQSEGKKVLLAAADTSRGGD